MDIKPKAYSYIRFSTPEQAKGDSLKRQLKLAEEYCNKNALILDKSLNFTDKGISAFKGQNRIKGALGKFLQLVKNGTIAKGSILLVENLDRLSREYVDDAYDQFRNIINAGIKVVTLQDGMEYDKKSMRANWSQLIISITCMARANEESLVKSKRLSESWNSKREKAVKRKRKLTAKTPYWLSLSEDKTKFIKIPKVCKAIELIFKKKLEGKGSYLIEKELNLHKNIWRPPKSNRTESGGWRVSYINKILRNPAVIGDYQPHKIIRMEDDLGKEIKKRIPEGELIKDYYSDIISESLFYKVQKILDDNAKKKGRGGGRKDKGRNLFSHVVKCGICGSTMQYLNKGKINWQYLMCDSRKRKNKVPISIKYAEKQSKINNSKDKKVEIVCTAKTVRYDEFERIILENLNELDINELLPNEDETTKLKKEKEGELAKNRHELKELESKRDYLVELLISNRDKETLEKFNIKNEKIKDDIALLKKENKNLLQDIENLTKQRDKLKKQKERIKEIHSFLEFPNDKQERINRRFQLRQEIQNMIEWIEIHPLKKENQNTEEMELSIIKDKAKKPIYKILIKFKASKTFMRVIFVTSDGEQAISRGWPRARK